MKINELIGRVEEVPRMSKKTGFSRFILVLCLFAYLTSTSIGQETKPLTNADVVGMVRQKLPTSVIESVIRASQTQFDVSVPALAKLGKQGVPESTVAFMVEVTKPAQTTPRSGEKPAPAQSGASSSKSLPLKRIGIYRIGIVTTQSVVPIEQDEAVRAQFYEIIYGNRDTSTTEAVLMMEKLDRNIVSESILTKCDYLLFINLESTIQSAEERSRNFLQKSIKSGTEILGAASKIPSPLSGLAGITYRGYQMADSLSASTTLLGTITQVTRKKDKIGVNFRLLSVVDGKEVITRTLMEITAKKDREPILQNLLIQIGNEVVNAIPLTGNVHKL